MRHLVFNLGCGVREALMMATLNPARIFGLAGKGRLAPGADADILLLDEALCVRQVFLKGEEWQS